MPVTKFDKLKGSRCAVSDRSLPSVDPFGKKLLVHATYPSFLPLRSNALLITSGSKKRYSLKKNCLEEDGWGKERKYFVTAGRRKRRRYVVDKILFREDFSEVDVKKSGFSRSSYNAPQIPLFRRRVSAGGGDQSSPTLGCSRSRIEDWAPKFFDRKGVRICAKEKRFLPPHLGGLPLSFGPGLHRPRTERGEGAKAFLHGGRRTL